MLAGTYSNSHARSPPVPARGLEELRWRSEGIEPFIRDALEAVRDLDSVLATLKDNVRRTQVGAVAQAGGCEGVHAPAGKLHCPPVAWIPGGHTCHCSCSQTPPSPPLLTTTTAGGAARV